MIEPAAFIRVEWRTMKRIFISYGLLWPLKGQVDERYTKGIEF
jgi:hypothetical protein